MSVSNFFVSSTLSNSSDAMVLKKTALILTHLSLVLSQIQLHKVLFVIQSSQALRFLLLLNLPSYFLQEIAKVFLIRFLQLLNLMIQNLFVRLLKHLIFCLFVYIYFFSLLLKSANQIFVRTRRCLILPPYFKFLNYRSNDVMQQQRNATLPFTIIPLRSSAICIFLLNLLFSFILLTCSSCFILNFNILIYIRLTVLVFINFYTNSAGFLFRLMESNMSLIILILEFIHIFQFGAKFNKMTFSNRNLLNKARFIMVDHNFTKK